MHSSRRLPLASAFVFAALAIGCDSGKRTLAVSLPLGPFSEAPVVLRPNPPLTATGPLNELCLEFDRRDADIWVEDSLIGRGSPLKTHTGEVVRFRAAFSTAQGVRQELTSQGWMIQRRIHVCFRPLAQSGPYVRLELIADGPIAAERVTWFSGPYP
jgi:hypothetical protein